MKSFVGSFNLADTSLLVNAMFLIFGDVVDIVSDVNGRMSNFVRLVGARDRYLNGRGHEE